MLDNLLIPLFFFAIILIVNKSSRTFSSLTGFDLIFVVLGINYFFNDIAVSISEAIEPIKYILLVYFSFRIGLKSKRIFNQFSNLNFLKYSLFDLILNVLVIFSLLYYLTINYFPILFAGQHEGWILIVFISLVLTMGSKSLFQKLYINKVSQTELFKIPFTLIDIHQTILFFISGLFILFFNEHTHFLGLNESKTIFISISASIIFSIFIGYVINQFEKKREINVIIFSFTLIISGSCNYFNYSPMFIPLIIGFFTSLFVNDADKFKYISNDSKHFVTSILVGIFILELKLSYDIILLYMIVTVILTRFLSKLVIQKLTTFYFESDKMAIPGLHMLFIGQGKMSLILLMYFSISFKSPYNNEIALIILVSVLFFESLGMLRSKPEEIMSNKSMIKELET